jgi:DNA polymerase III delta subunit
MDANELKARIKSGSLSGVYIFGGEENYLVKYYLKLLSDAASGDEAFAVFNSVAFEGDEVDFEELAEAVKSPPMMADYKMIVWKRADFSAMKEKSLEALESLCELVSEHPWAVLAFSAKDEGLDFGTPKRPSSFIKRFGAKINVLRFDKSTENQLYAWLKKHFDSRGVGVTLDTLKELVFRSGKSMEVLASEVEKLSSLALARGLSTVGVSEVEEIATSSPECDTFALSTAIAERNRALMFDALMDMRSKRIDPTVIMGMMARTYSELLTVALLLEDGVGMADIEAILKINPYRLKHLAPAAKRYGAQRLSQIVESLSRVDAGAKFGGIVGYTAIELFVTQNI